jgi:hypothetical protein
VVCFKTFLTARELDMVARRDYLAFVIVGHFVRFDAHVAIRHDNVILGARNASFPNLRTGRRDLHLVLLCPEN